MARRTARTVAASSTGRINASARRRSPLPRTPRATTRRARSAHRSRRCRRRSAASRRASAARSAGRPASGDSAAGRSAAGTRARRGRSARRSRQTGRPLPRTTPRSRCAATARRRPRPLAGDARGEHDPGTHARSDAQRHGGVGIEETTITHGNEFATSGCATRMRAQASRTSPSSCGIAVSMNNGRSGYARRITRTLHSRSVTFACRPELRSIAGTGLDLLLHEIEQGPILLAADRREPRRVTQIKRPPDEQHGSLRQRYASAPCGTTRYCSGTLPAAAAPATSSATRSTSASVL